MGGDGGGKNKLAIERVIPGISIPIDVFYCKEWLCFLEKRRHQNFNDNNNKRMCATLDQKS